MLLCELLLFGGVVIVGGMFVVVLLGLCCLWVGVVWDFVFGCCVIIGYVKYLCFGGEVMKNVVGYDVLCLLVGSFGCFGVVIEVLLKVLLKLCVMCDFVLMFVVSEVV